MITKRITTYFLECPDNVPHAILEGDCALCQRDTATQYARTIAEAFRFLSRRCEELGFYGPNRQPQMLEAHRIADLVLSQNPVYSDHGDRR